MYSGKMLSGLMDMAEQALKNYPLDPALARRTIKHCLEMAEADGRQAATIAMGREILDRTRTTQEAV